MKTTRSFATIASVVCALTASLPACDGDTVTLAPPPTEDGAFRAGETWTGYIESFRFASGSELVTIKFTTPTEGTVSFGAPPNGPQVVNPDVGFPTDLIPTSSASYLPILAAQLEQFAFTMRDAKREDRRMRFALNLGEVWRSWCAAQTKTYAVMKLPDNTPAFNCVPADDWGEHAPGAAIPTGAPGQCFPFDQFAQGNEQKPKLAFDCAKANLCGSLRVCACDAVGCWFSPLWEGPTPPYGVGTLAFDIHIDGDKADGSTGLGRGFFRRQ